jgi:hypothetical protein
MNDQHILAEEHSLLREMIFRGKITGLTFTRFFKNWFAYRDRKFSFSTTLRNSSVIASSESPLWNPDDNSMNWILTAGKIENLRIAVRKIHGLEIQANAIFSFWKHIGYPGTLKGFVVGREIREGCIVPTIAGGICQLSNALYDVALNAGFEIIERHKHTQVIKGSLAEVNRDATVKWNYLDLRFKSQQRFRIEAELTTDKLIVRFKSPENQKSKKEESNIFKTPSFLNDCYSCGNVSCFKNPNQSEQPAPRQKTSYIVDERWPEYEEYVRHAIKAGDEMIVPFKSSQPFVIKRLAWPAAPRTETKSVWMPASLLALTLKFFSKSRRNIFALTMQRDKIMAERMIHKISVASTHVVISQNLLPYAWATGVLGGRTFDVLMTRLPMEKLHQRLDFAFQKFAESPTLHDFRADDEVVNAETEALNASRKIITPHREIAQIFNHKSVYLNWMTPSITKKPDAGDAILFPASSLGRKGAYEMRRLARDLDLPVTVLGSATEHDNFWQGLRASTTPLKDFSNVRVVVYPAYVEHQPRVLLRAIACGVPVITTTAAGIAAGPNVIIVPVGDYDALREALLSITQPVSAT